MFITGPGVSGKSFQSYPEATYFYNARYRFVYAPVPKSACSSLKVILYRLQLLEQSGLPVFNKRDFGGRSFHMFMDFSYTLSRKTAVEACDILRSPDIFKFTFVRHPLDRIASAYLNKFVAERYNSEQWEHTMPVLKNFFGEKVNPFSDAITFEQFVSYLTRVPDDALDKHWISQHCFLAPDIDFHIGRVEDFDVDFRKFAKRLGLPVEAIHANQTGPSRVELREEPYWNMLPDQLRKLPVLPPNRMMYSPELEQAIRRRYVVDIDRFGYSD